MKHLILGASGFLGRHLVEVLKKNGESIYTVSLQELSLGQERHLQCDLVSEEERLEAFIQAIQPDRIFHLVGMPHALDRYGFPAFFEKNVLSTVHLLNALKHLKHPVRLFFASTIHVYGNQEEASESTSLQPSSFYSYSKFLAENILQSELKNLPHLKVIVGRLYSCIGPGQSTGFVVSDFCRRIAELPPKGGELLVGPLSSKRQFTDVRDAMGLLPLLLEQEQEKRFEVVHLASPHLVSVQEILEILLRVSGKAPVLKSQDMHFKNKFLGLRADTKKLEKIVGSDYFRPLEQTLTDTYHWTLQEMQGQE